MTTTEPRRPAPQRRPRRTAADSQAREAERRSSAARAARPDRVTDDRDDRPERGSRPDRAARNDRTARTGRPDRAERAARPDRQARTRRPERDDRTVRPDRAVPNRDRPNRRTTDGATAGRRPGRSTTDGTPTTRRPARPTASTGTAPTRTGSSRPTRISGADAPDTTRPSGAQRPVKAGGAKKAERRRSHRGRRSRRDLAVRVDLRRRSWIALGLMGVLLVAAAVKLVFIQAVDAEALAATGANQRTRTVELPAVRGSITDRSGTALAFTIEGRALATRPANFVDDDPTKQTVTSYSGEKNPPRTADEKRALLAGLVMTAVGDDFPQPDGTPLTAEVLIEKMSNPDPDRKFIYLARKVLPAQADTILAGWRDIATTETEYNALAADREAIRENPEGAATLSLVGRTGWDEAGLSGIEAKYNALLTGTNGSITRQVYSGGNPIPNTVSDETAAVNGTSVALTLDADLQYAVGEMVAQQVAATGAKQGCALVLSVDQSQVHAMICHRADGQDPGNAALTMLFEPGSVNKVVTFAAALEQGLITPDTVLSVDGRISVGGRYIHDAWPHDPIDMTATGVLAKSSNVGTLMLAQQIGEDAFVEKMAAFGLGSKTGFELFEEAGLMPATWSATTFGNLPIGQGVSVTLLQLASMYQAIGNDGVRITPSIVAGTTAPDGTFTASAPRATSQVIPADTADTLVDMLRATVQDGDVAHRGTGVPAAVNGYQVAGKTGTAQQIDPETNAYSDTLHNATFVGLIPADAPKYSIAVMLDAPVAGSPGGTSAAPLFHDIAAYAMRADNVPPSAEAAPVYDLYVGSNQ